MSWTHPTIKTVSYIWLLMIQSSWMYYSYCSKCCGDLTHRYCCKDESHAVSHPSTNLIVFGVVGLIVSIFFTWGVVTCYRKKKQEQPKIEDDANTSSGAQLNQLTSTSPASMAEQPTAPEMLMQPMAPVRHHVLPFPPPMPPMYYEPPYNPHVQQMPTAMFYA